MDSSQHEHLRFDGGRAAGGVAGSLISGLVAAALAGAMLGLGGCGGGRSVAPVDDLLAQPGGTGTAIGTGAGRVARGHGGVTTSSTGAAVEVMPEATSRPGYVVKSGDTLYSIAFANDLDYRELATWNAIDDSYLIKVGQTLVLTPPTNRVAASASAARQRVTPAKAPAAAARQPLVVASGKAASRANKAVASVATKADPAPTNTARTERKTGTATKTVAPAKETWPVGKLAWQWPTQGRVVKRFSSKGTSKRGIAIAGKAGQIVRAAAPGKVVYAGTGLVGYGKLIIIKHNKTYLSAYAHNRTLKVSEGAWVRAGTAIAEMGSTGTDKTMLHFEIRRRGKPINPTGLLPRR